MFVFSKTLAFNKFGTIKGSHCVLETFGEDRAENYCYGKGVCTKIFLSVIKLGSR